MTLLDLSESGRLRSGLLRLLLCMLLACLAGIGFAEPLQTASGAVKVTLLYTNDHHSHLMPSDLPDFGNQVGGMARRHALIQSIRASESCVLLLDGGDIFQGTPFYSFFKGKADIEAYSLCGYDATTLGNHDLDDGLANNIEQYKHASFPILCANVVYASDSSPVFTSSRMIERSGLHIGLIGVIGSAAWDVIALANRKGMNLVDPADAVASVVADLRPRSDLVVLLSHSGYEQDLELAGRVPGIDVIIGGHTNTFVEKPTVVKHEPIFVPPTSGKGMGTVVVQAFKWGVFLGRLDLAIRRGGPVLDAGGGLIPITASISVPLDSPMSRLVESYDELIRAQTTQVVGQSAAVFLYPEDRKHRESLPLGTLVGKSLIEFTGADMAIINSGSIRDILPAGPITMGRVFSMLPFDNTVVTLSMRGRDIVEMFNYLCRNYGIITGYQYGGMTCTFDIAQKSVKDLKISGTAVDPEKTYRVVTISYLSDGNQNGAELFKHAFAKRDDGYYYREAFLDFIRRHGTITMPEFPSLLTITGNASATPAYGSK
ncbi:MAG TPA: bifunctional UDP-sugar hydrolase/5'-nucleotidase [Candidatus Ozemobacteraceae bacterium]|nr:bifunctional UDP-sugar hydrolase/5'-nucleotidase [Candidatus Ozemobacteraceae bacterium]